MLPLVAVSTVRSCAAAPGGMASAAAALASQANVFRLRRLDTVVSVEEGHRLAHLHYPRAGAVPDVLAERLGAGHVRGHQQRPPVLVAPVDHRVELLEAPLVLLRDGEILEHQ